MTYRAIPAILLCLCASLPATAADLALSIGGGGEYDTNVFRTENDTEDDFLFRLRPGIRLYEDRGDDLNYSILYEAPIELPVQYFDDLWDVDQIARGNARYHVNDQLEIFAHDNFGYLRSTFRTVNDEDGPSGTGQPTIDNQRNRVTTNEAAVGLSYLFEPRWQGRALVRSNYFKPTRDDRSTVWTIGGTVDSSYALTERHQVGGGFGYDYQNFSDRTGIEGSYTNTYNLFVSWRWTVDDTTNLELRVGPGYLQTRQQSSSSLRSVPTIPAVLIQEGSTVIGAFQKDGVTALDPNTFQNQDGVLVSAQVPTLNKPNCPIIDGRNVASACFYNIGLTGADAQAVLNAAPTAVFNTDTNGATDSTLTVFASVTATKYWTPTLSTAVSYDRQQGDASGLGGSVIADAVSLANTWDFAERWQLALRGDWVHRKSASNTQATYDVVSNQVFVPLGVGAVPIATRNGFAFNSDQGAEIDTNRWSVAGRVTHQLFKRTTIYAQVRYDDQNSQSDSLASSSDFTGLLATFGFVHTFEPITLW